MPVVEMQLVAAAAEKHPGRPRLFPPSAAPTTVESASGSLERAQPHRDLLYRQGPQSGLSGLRLRNWFPHWVQ